MNPKHPLFKISLLSLAVATTSLVQAQNETVEEEVVVTGYRGALQTSAAAKRESLGFTDAIYADDLGKLPSQNLAESLNRIPGVKIAREVTGEGLQISVRGLGSSFTKVNLNGNNISVASDGSLGAGNRGRGLDLGLFPTEFFGSLAVSKSQDASQMEGGISGFVNMKTLRPFDRDGQQINFALDGAYTEINEEISPKGSFLYSNTFNDQFGVLVGLTFNKSKSRTDGYETVGYADGCLVDDTSAPTYTCAAGQVGRNIFHWNPRATADYVATHPGTTLGQSLDLNQLSGLSNTELDHGILPYLGRGMKLEGERDLTSQLVSFEYKFNDNMSAALDIMATQGDRDFNRIDNMLWVRRAFNQQDGLIPENLVIDDNEVIREATLYNSQFWVEARYYEEEVNFLSVMPSFSWNISDTLKMDISASRTESDFYRESPTWLYTSPKGIATYKLANNVGSFSFNVPGSDFGLNGNPDGSVTGWTWGGGGASAAAGAARFNIDKRDTETNGLHADFAYGEDADRNGIKFGFSYDDSSQFMEAYGNGNHTTVVSSAIPDVNQVLKPMKNDLGNTMGGSGLGYSGFAQIDYAAAKKLYDYDAIVAGATRGGDQFGQPVGDIDESYTAAYLMVNAESEIAGRPMRTNVGVRWVDTDQWVGSLDSATQATLSAEANYKEWLPSLSAVYDLADDIKVRFSASRSMTRANPADMFPNASFSGSGIDSARAGNPLLSPFFANNVDIGGEWYFDDIGYVGLTLFEKSVRGFTFSSTKTVQWLDLPNYGLDISQPTPTQLQALNACGGPSSAACNTVVSTRLNADGSTYLTGGELVWVQPLDFIIEGLGFDASATKINQSADGPQVEVTGISPWSYNFTGFYENENLSIRLTYFHQDKAKASGFLDSNYDGDPLPARFSYALARSQVDLATSYTLPFTFGDNGELVVTFDVYNLTNEPVGDWYQYEGVSQNYFEPGATYTLGIRGKF